MALCVLLICLAGAYSYGDFMVHLAGLDEKTRWAAEILRELKED